MDPTNGGDPGAAPPPPELSPESLPIFEEAVSLVLSRWTALQMAVEDGWGGRDSRRKSHELASDLVSWFTQSKDPLYIDDLENMLDESMVLYFNTEIEDGSVEEVVEQLMIIHEECLQANYESIEKLRKSNPGTHAITQSRRMVNENEDESSDEEVADMMVDGPNTKDMAVDSQEPNRVQKQQEPNEDGWSVVPPRRNRGKRAG